MSRYRGPKWKLSRRVGFSLSETGKELNGKRGEKRPGQHGDGRKKESEYGSQLKEKQKLRFMYGINERQFKKIFNESAKLEGIHGENFLKMLESRLDSLVYRAGFAINRNQARQMVNHGHILVDNKKVNIPSYIVKPGQVISLKEKSRNLKIVTESLANLKSRLDFIKFDDKNLSATYERLPNRDELNDQINEAMIIEYYNR